MGLSSKIRSLQKVLRFVKLYGFRRTLIKIAGRMRFPVSLVWRRAKTTDVALIGCGQFGMTAIGYFVTQQFGKRILNCFDINQSAAASCQKTLGIGYIADTSEQSIDDPKINYVYIASNHASHTEYACYGMKSGKTVYVEKPVSVSLQQFKQLCKTRRQTGMKLYAGYNRPFSGAIKKIKSIAGPSQRPISLNCFVSGHVIEQDHWYRLPDEGTRICGNAGHWIDLFVHILSWREIPNTYEIAILSAKSEEPDDNFTLSITTDFGDIFSLMLTARTEPFEGINETINLQSDDLIAKIDDFRRLTVWQETKKQTYRFWPKDVGHKRAIMQPFEPEPSRSWHEVEVSTLIMLTCTEMVRNGVAKSTIKIDEEFEKLSKIS